MTTSQCLFPHYFREEHKAHSPKCEFLLLNKREEDWTVEDLLELETKRQINRMVNFVLHFAYGFLLMVRNYITLCKMVLENKRQQSQKLLFHPRIKNTNV